MNIIAYGDAINHAIFNAEEVESGLFRLLKGGWILASGDLFEPSSKTRILYSKCENQSSLKLMDSLGKAVGIPGWSVKDSSPDLRNVHRYTGFTQEKFDKAVKEYLAIKKPKHI